MKTQRISNDSFTYLSCLFFMGSAIGFIWEAIIYWIHHTLSFTQVLFEFRGFLHGTWVPIYGVGILLIYLMSKKIRNNEFLTFLCSASLCSLVEYATSWSLENFFHITLWDYSDQLFNLNGRISLLSILFFGCAGVFVIRYFEPIFRKVYLFFPKYIRLFSCIILTVLFIVDVINSLLIILL